MPPKKVVRQRGLQCPFNSSQYISICLHLLTTAIFIAFVAVGAISDATTLLLSIIIFTSLTTFIVSAWIFTSYVDSSVAPSNGCERCFCGMLYCFKRAQLKTRYCAVSKKKVPGMDHYCVWMNTAIGARNYPGFFLVALLSTLLLWFQIIISIVGLMSAKATTMIITFSVVQLLCSIGVASPYTTLLFFHLYLICKQTSTFDYLMNQAKLKAKKRKAAINDTNKPKVGGTEKINENTNPTQTTTYEEAA